MVPSNKIATKDQRKGEEKEKKNVIYYYGHSLAGPIVSVKISSVNVRHGYTQVYKDVMV
jgi:hypothetical protein